MQLQLTIEGNLAAEPHLDVIEDGTSVCHFRVLHTARRHVNGAWRDGETTGVDVTCWGTLADRAAESLHKGDCVIVAGDDPASQPWVARDGESRASLTLTARTLALSLRFREASSRRVAV